MNTTADVAALSQAGLNALRAGDAALARRLFEQIVATGRAEPSMWTALAMACERLGDGPAAEAAADQVMAAEPHNLRALLIKANAVNATNTRAAHQFYTLALRLAERARSLPPDLTEALRNAKIQCDRNSAEMMQHLRDSLKSAGYDEHSSSSRFTLSLDLLSGKKQPYVQQPRAYLFPELPQIQFYDTAQFSWVHEIEAATEQIAAELDAALADGDDAFTPYLQASAGVLPADREKLVRMSNWTALFLVKEGAPTGYAGRCPITLRCLEAAPLMRMETRAPNVLFSQLLPGAHIRPHTGFINARLICHLPLIVPEGCALRVGNQERPWVRGKICVFDDTIEHEAWNRGTSRRIVLIFDVWRPELSDEERLLVKTLFEAIDTYGAGAKWED